MATQTTRHTSASRTSVLAAKSAHKLSLLFPRVFGDSPDPDVLAVPAAAGGPASSPPPRILNNLVFSLGFMGWGAQRVAKSLIHLSYNSKLASAACRALRGVQLYNIYTKFSTLYMLQLYYVSYYVYSCTKFSTSAVSIYSCTFGTPGTKNLVA